MGTPPAVTRAGDDEIVDVGLDLQDGLDGVGAEDPAGVGALLEGRAVALDGDAVGVSEE